MKRFTIQSDETQYEKTENENEIDISHISTCDGQDDEETYDAVVMTESVSDKGTQLDEKNNNACPKCTFINSASAVACEICGYKLITNVCMNNLNIIILFNP
jgi:DNA-directed RNA polymerase subunit RPC12/RpoP